MEESLPFKYILSKVILGNIMQYNVTLTLQIFQVWQSITCTSSGKVYHPENDEVNKIQNISLCFHYVYRFKYALNLIRDKLLWLSSSYILWLLSVSFQATSSKIKNSVDRMSMNFVGSLLLKQQQVTLFLKRSAKSPNMTLSEFQ